MITSPNYPNKYENNVDCHVTIRYTGSRVRLQLVDVAIEYYRLYIRCHLSTGLEREHHCKLPTDWLEIRDGNSTSSKLIAKIAGHSSWPTGHSTGLLDVSKKHPTFFKEIPEIVSSGEFMTVIFHSNDKNRDFYAGGKDWTGFRLIAGIGNLFSINKWSS